MAARNSAGTLDINIEDYRVRREYFGGILFFRPKARLLFVNEVAVEGFQVFLDVGQTADAVAEFSRRKAVSLDESARFYTLLVNQLKSATSSGLQYRDRILPSELGVIESVPLSDRFLSAPVYFAWEITDQCNFPCVYCSTSAQLFNGGDPTTYSEQEAFDIANNIIQGDVFHVFFTGGEPLIVPYILKLSKHLLDAKVTIMIATNGSLVSDHIDELTALAEVHGRYFGLQVKLDTIQGDRYKRLTGTSAAMMRRVTDAIELLNSRNIPFVVQAGFTPDTRSDLQPMVHWLAGLSSCQHFNVNTLSRVGRAKRLCGLGLMEWTTEEKTDFLHAIAKVKSVRSDFLSYSQLVNDWFPLVPPDRSGTIYDCKAGRMYLRLKSNGRLAPCNGNRDIEVGELRDKSINTVWHSTELLNVRQHGLKCPLRIQAGNDSSQLLRLSAGLELVIS